MRLNIVEIREDDEGDLWFLVERYYESSSGEIAEDWWLHLSDEYAFMGRDAIGAPINGKRYTLVEKTEDE